MSLNKSSKSFLEKHASWEWIQLSHENDPNIKKVSLNRNPTEMVKTLYMSNTWSAKENWYADTQLYWTCNWKNYEFIAMITFKLIQSFLKSKSWPLKIFVWQLVWHLNRCDYFFLAISLSSCRRFLQSHCNTQKKSRTHKCICIWKNNCAKKLASTAEIHYCPLNHVVPEYFPNRCSLFWRVPKQKEDGEQPINNVMNCLNTKNTW